MYEAIIEERIIKPFEEKTGIDVVYDAVGSASQDYAKIKAIKGQPGFDVVVMTASQALQSCKDGLLENLDVAAISNLEKLAQAALDDVFLCLCAASAYVEWRPNDCQHVVYRRSTSHRLETAQPAGKARGIHEHVRRGRWR
jgi:spermidine/putrescine-binding protein